MKMSKKFLKKAAVMTTVMSLAAVPVVSSAACGDGYGGYNFQNQNYTGYQNYQNYHNWYSQWNSYNQYPNCGNDWFSSQNPDNNVNDDNIGSETPDNDVNDDYTGNETPDSDVNDDYIGSETPDNDANDDYIGNETPDSDSNDDAYGNNGDTDSDTGAATGYAAEVASLVNEQRAANGLSALGYSTEAAKVAQLKAEDMAANNYFSHTSPTYGSAFDMLKTYNVSYKSAGENIAKGQTSPSSVMNAWMNSSGHKANILGSTYTDIGVGYAADSNGNQYWVQVFIGK